MVMCSSQYHWNHNMVMAALAYMVNGQSKELNSDSLRLSVPHLLALFLGWGSLVDKSAVDPLPSLVSLLPISSLFPFFLSPSPLLSLHLTCLTLSLITPSSFTQQEFGRGLRVCVCVARGQPAPVYSRGLLQGQHRGFCPCLTPWKKSKCVCV